MLDDGDGDLHDHPFNVDNSDILHHPGDVDGDLLDHPGDVDDEDRDSCWFMMVMLMMVT